MKKTMGIGFVLVALALLFVPIQASACKSCDVPAFWDPNCSHSGCTYCVACTACCGGNPGGGPNCNLYCGGALASTQTVPDFLLALTDQPGEAPLSRQSSAQCPSPGR